MTSDYAKGRADALKEAAAVARNWGAQGRAIAQQIESLAQQPKRECGTCRFKWDDGECLDCIYGPVTYDNWQPKAGA